MLDKRFGVFNLTLSVQNSRLGTVLPLSTIRARGDEVSIFGKIINNARSDEPEPEPISEPEPTPEVTAKAEVISSKNREGKRSHPDYRQTTIYIRKELHRKLMRILEDSDYQGDFSQWVEEQMLHEVSKPK
jgi:hypothetical protein